MAVERAPHQQWADSQREALLDLGFDLVDVETRIAWVLDNLPAGEDPATYIFPAHLLWQEPSAHVQDARVAWMAADSVPPRAAGYCRRMMELLVAVTFALGLCLNYCVNDDARLAIGRWILDRARSHAR